MLRHLLALLFVALAPQSARAAAIEEDLNGHDADLVRVFLCRFEDNPWDINYDAWPDRWTRVHDVDHPHYARMEIVPADSEEIPGRVFQIQPDGASATATSPPIHVMPKFSYKLRLRARATGAEHGAARVRLTFQAHDEVLQVEQTEPLIADGKWRELELGDFEPYDTRIDRVYLSVDYQRGDRGDLHAEVQIADVRLYRLPSIKISTGSRYNVYTDPSDVVVTCTLSGILEQNPEIRFQLLDATDQSIGDGGQILLDGREIYVEKALASDIVDGFGSDKSSYEGTTKWIPPINEYGFYRVRVGMYNPETDKSIGEARAITLAVVRPGLETSEQGEFGWSLPWADHPLPFPVLQELLPRVGVRQVKLPVWFQPGDEARSDAIIRFAEQLAARGIETIGVLEDPTPQIKDPLSRVVPPPIEGLLSSDPSYWTPLIDHVITRLSLRIRWWQLGRDSDTSFVGYQKLIGKLSAIRNQMFRFGQDIRLGIGWRWDHARDWKKPLPWDFEQMSGRENFDADGLGAALASSPATTSHRWVLVAPPEVPLQIPPGANLEDTSNPLMRQALVRRHQQRVRDFVEQVLVAKMHGVDGIFIADPFAGSAEATSDQTGVMNTDGTPGELLLPWRTCARLLGGATYLGSIQLPNHSNNWLFKRPDGRVVMVLWNLDAPVEDANATPIEEALYLGENVQSIDVWGASNTPETVQGRQVIHVGRMPRFVLGLNEAIARWRMAVQFETIDVPSVFNVAHDNTVMLRNTFKQGVGGKLRVFVPSRGEAEAAFSASQAREWVVTLNEERLRLPASSESQAPIQIVLQDASYGDQPVRLDFEITADQDYKFSAWRKLHVGLQDIELDVVTYTGRDGRLIVEQRMSKESGPPANFKCLLYADGRRRKRTQVFQLGSEVDKKRYTYLDSSGLIGTSMRLRLEESDGGRVLIHRFLVDPVPQAEVEKLTDDKPTRKNSA